MKFVDNEKTRESVKIGRGLVVIDFKDDKANPIYLICDSLDIVNNKQIYKIVDLDRSYVLLEEFDSPESAYEYILKSLTDSKNVMIFNPEELVLTRDIK